jgi:hypothetical protein
MFPRKLEGKKKFASLCLSIDAIVITKVFFFDYKTDKKHPFLYSDSTAVRKAEDARIDSLRI